jgi:hypothetical protein
MKKIIGFVLWALAFALPFRAAILETDDTVLDAPAGTIPFPDNITGLISFVIMLGLLFGGYILVDSAKKPAGESHGHGH